ncbi:MAG: hypothetical protein ACRCS8_02840 [Brevinema sp.]
MLRYLILMTVLILGACSEKKTSSKTSEVAVSTNEVSHTNIEPIEVSYDKGLDLILVETSFKGTIPRILDNRDEGLDYQAIYWDSNNNSYYIIEDDNVFLRPLAISDTYTQLSPSTYPPLKTNFTYTIDETKQLEPVFDDSLREVFPNTGAPLLYIGSISPMERVYLNPTNQLYYIKKLKFWDTSIYEVYIYTNDGKLNHPYKKITNVTPIVYPVMFTNFSTNSRKDIEVIINTYFTNTNNQRFYPVSSDIEGDPDILFYSRS